MSAPSNSDPSSTEKRTDEAARLPNTPHPQDPWPPLVHSAGLKAYKAYDKHQRLEDKRFSDEQLVAGPANGKTLLSEEEALAILSNKGTLEGVAIRSLRLRGAFTGPILIRRSYIHHLEITDFTTTHAVSILGCEMNRLHIERSVFRESLSLKRSRTQHFSILNVRLWSLSCDHLQTAQQCFFIQCHVSQHLRMWDGRFGRWVTWDACHFDGPVDMRATEMQAGFSATGCHFKKAVKFRGAVLRLKWEAPGSRFEGLLDFSKAKLHDFVYLEEIEQGPGQRWAFMNTVCDRLLVSPAQIAGRLESEDRNDHTQMMVEYGVLKRSFAHEQRYRSEDWAFYHFKLNERRARSVSWSQPLQKLQRFAEWLFLDWGCAYGTSPTKALRSALVMILFFAVLYTLGSEHLYPPEQLPFAHLSKDHLLNTATTSLLLSVSAFTSGFGDIKNAAMGWMNLLLMTEALLGTILWGLFIVAFGRKVIR